MTHSPRFCLGAVTPFSFPEGALVPARASMRTCRRVDEATVSEFHRSVQEIKEFDQADRLYIVFDRNLTTFFAFLESVLESHLVDPMTTHSMLRLHLIEIDRLLLNILTAMRTFLDHAETWLKRTFGHKSEQFERFRAARSREYDLHFAYRFFYYLRNYAQHCGLPAGSINVTSQSTRLRPAPERLPTDSLRSGPHVIGVYFSRDNLLANFDGWKKVEAELRVRRTEMEITRELRSLGASIQRLHRVLRNLLAAGPRKAARFLARLFLEVQRQHPYCEPVLLQLPARVRKGTPVNVTVHHFPLVEMRGLLRSDVAIQYEYSTATEPPNPSAAEADAGHPIEGSG